MFVHDGTERQAVPPARGEVVDVDIRVSAKDKEESIINSSLLLHNNIFIL